MTESIIHYLLLDAARLGDHLTTAQVLNSANLCLYKYKMEEELSEVAPFLFTFNETTDFGNWYLFNGWGASWGTLFTSNNSFENCWKHFRKFLLVKTEDGQELYFRFYDPRVLRIFLPTCNQEQLLQFFGPIESFICEDEDPHYALVFYLENADLKIDRTTKEQVFSTSLAAEQETSQTMIIQ